MRGADRPLMLLPTRPARGMTDSACLRRPSHMFGDIYSCICVSLKRVMHRRRLTGAMEQDRL